MILFQMNEAHSIPRSLFQMKQIGYKTRPGDRKRYFYSKLGEWQNSFRDRINGLTPYNEIIHSILKNRTEETKDFNAKLRDFTEFIEYYQKESIKIIDNWEKR